jgi:hypothetical protein
MNSLCFSPQLLEVKSPKPKDKTSRIVALLLYQSKGGNVPKPKDLPSRIVVKNCVTLHLVGYIYEYY